MLKKIRRWFLEAAMEGEYSPVVIGKHEIWVKKEFAKAIQERIDGILTISKFLEYDVEIVKYTNKKQLVVHIYEKNSYKLKLFPEKVGIVIGLNKLTPSFFSTFTKSPSGRRKFDYCQLKYKKFIQSLESLSGGL